MTKTTIEYISEEVDTLGRCHFFLNWKDANGKKRSQVFFAKPEDFGHKNKFN